MTGPTTPRDDHQASENGSCLWFLALLAGAVLAITVLCFIGGSWLWGRWN